MEEKEVERSEERQDFVAESVESGEDNTASADDGKLDEYQQINNYKDMLFNDLLGDYDEFGEYSINQDIMQDLIDMPKKIDYVDEAGIHARGFLGDHTFSFLISAPVEKEDGEAYCYLKLDEQIDRMAGFQFETITSVIATYCYKFDEFYDQHVREVFNLREYEGDDTGEEGRQFRADYITSRYDLFYTMRACSEDYYEKLEEIYFNHRMMMLGMDPELTVLMAEFNKKRLKLEPYLIVSRRRFYFLNQLLDEVLQMQAERLNKSEIAERMEQLDAKYIEKSQAIKQKTLENPKVVALTPKTSNVDNMARSAEKKPTPAPKKGVSKGGGDKPKSKPKKKGGKGKGGGKKGGKAPEKPKTPGKAGPKTVAPPSLPDLLITSFADNVKELGGEGDMFGHMQM